MLIIAFAALTTTILLLGIGSMAAGKDLNKKYSTKLMSLRVLFQALTIICLAIIYLNTRN